MESNYIFEPVPRPVLTVAGTQALFPVHRIYCVGRNYAAHAREMGHGDREPPFFFSKPPDAVTQSAIVPWPPATSELHHEVELVVAIGTKGRALDPDHALDIVFGYAVGVDLTRRDLQAEAKKKARPWDVAKGFDASAPVSEICPSFPGSHPRGGIELSVEGELRQSGDLADMIWSVAEIISELSTYFYLQPGDLIFTGTPEGVGPLKPGQKVECRVQELTRLTFTMGLEND